MPHRLDVRDAGFATDFARFLTAKRELLEDVECDVAEILAGVRARGDQALIAYTERFDGQTLTAAALRVAEPELEDAETACTESALAALRLAAQRITDYHSKQRPAKLDYRDAVGIRLGHRWTAVQAVGVYVPGGTAAYPSSVLMSLLPAKVAGVGRVVMATPTPSGRINPLVLAAARLAGVDEVYRVGGAQAIAALAYGTETIRAVDKVVGPGNAYVAEAKRQVFGTVGIDMIAGPSEVLVVADAQNDPRWIAADLVAQAEHDKAAQAILITDDEAFAEQVERALQQHLQQLPRSEIARESWETHGAIILVTAMSEVPDLVDQVAPEHLELAVAEPDLLAEAISNAGAIFLGRYTPEAIGDYLAGPSHVLPTGRSARFSSGLSVLDFMKRSSIIACEPEGLAAVGRAAITLAEAEGLEAHALSVAIRLERSDQN